MSPADSSTDLVRYEIRDRVAEITLSREPVNAINHQLIEELLAAYDRARHDPDARAVILKSDCAKAFSAGMDLKMIQGGNGLDLRRFLEKLYFGMHDAQYRMGKPTIDALEGPARAAGMTLAVSCDMVIAADDVDFSYPEVAVGVIPAMHFVHLPRQIGRHKAFELLFTGDTIAAPEAAERGLINYAVPRNRVLATARDYAAKFSSMSPVVTQWARDSFMRANDFEYRRAIENTVDTICGIINTDDSQEGLNAFNEKRPPNW